MSRLAFNRVAMWGGGLGVVALAVLILAAGRGESQVTPQVISNGGAREWVAFEPLVTVVSTHQSFNILRLFQIVNTSTERSTYTITLERTTAPLRITICTGTLQPGQRKVCGGVGRARNGYADGYYQVRASQPVLMGGHVNLPQEDYELVTSGTPRLRFKDRGTIQHLPFDWQQGCPPKAGTGCAGSGGPPGNAQ
jgi:hypothetical protein